MKLGVFDSGVGGKAVATELAQAFPEIDIVLREDRENLPYGTKQPEELYRLVLPILASMAEDGCDPIIIACNTVSTTILPRLQTALPQCSLIGVEPMVAQAATMSKSKVIAVCATLATLNSGRYHELKARYAKKVTVLEPDCSDWALMVENINAMDFDKIRARILPVIKQGADVIVLGCTHYHWIEDEIRDMAGQSAEVLQPVPALIRQLADIIDR